MFSRPFWVVSPLDAPCLAPVTVAKIWTAMKVAPCVDDVLCLGPGVDGFYSRAGGRGNGGCGCLAGTPIIRILRAWRKYQGDTTMATTLINDYEVMYSA